MAFSRFNPGCCCSTECVPGEVSYSRIESESTETMGGTTYDRFDIEQIDDDRIWAGASPVNYVVFEISDGSFYRIAFPTHEDWNPIRECKIEVSRDSKETWETVKTIKTDGSAQEAIIGAGDLSARKSACNDYRTGLKSSVGYDYIIDGAQDQYGNVFGYGTTGSGCYLGLGTKVVDTRDHDNFYVLDCWDTKSGRGDHSVDMLITLENDRSIVDVYTLAPEDTPHVDLYWTRMTDYVGFDCLRHRDPNCGLLCPASYPNSMLKVTSCSFTVDGAITKTVESNTGFDAADGYTKLINHWQVQESYPGSQEFFNLLNSYVNTSIPEYENRGVARCYAGNHAQRRSYLGNPCEYICNWSNVYATKVLPYHFWYSGIIYYGTSSIWGGNSTNFGYIAAVGPHVPRFSWVGGGSENDYVVDFTIADDPDYTGENISKETMGENGQLSVKVVEETECTVTLELTIYDHSLYHGESSVLTGAKPYWEAPLSVERWGENDYRCTYYADYASESYYNTPNVPVSIYSTPGVLVAELVKNDDQNPVYGDGSDELPNANYNDSWPDPPEVGVDVYPRVTQSEYGYWTVNPKGSVKDAEWQRWVVTFRKTIQKADLPTTTLVEFTGDDVYSSNYTEDRKTLRPDPGNGWEVGNQVSVCEVMDGNHPEWWTSYKYSLAYILKPRDYAAETVNLVPSDWSATITLDPTPYVS